MCINRFKSTFNKAIRVCIDEKAVKRAGLDYWKELNLEVHESYEDFINKYGDKRIFLATTHGGEYYDEEIPKRRLYNVWKRNMWSSRRCS